MTQADLFCDDRARVLVGLERREQGEQLERVGRAIGPAVIEFFALHCGQEFHASQLHAFVSMRRGYTAPASADRVMRAMNGKEIRYQLVSKPKSLYRALP